MWSSFRIKRYFTTLMCLKDRNGICELAIHDVNCRKEEEAIYSVQRPSWRDVPATHPRLIYISIKFLIIYIVKKKKK